MYQISMLWLTLRDPLRMSVFFIFYFWLEVLLLPGHFPQLFSTERSINLSVLFHQWPSVHSFYKEKLFFKSKSPIYTNKQCTYMTYDHQQPEDHMGDGFVTRNMGDPLTKFFSR